MKACHPDGVRPVSKNRNILLIGLGVAAIAVVGAAMTREDTSGPLQATPTRPMTAPIQNQAAPATQKSGAGTPQPGPAPPGKVWSPEHGHWHDEPGATSAAPGSQVSLGQNQSIKMPSPQVATKQPANQPAAKNIPQPSGIAPAGKVWSPEHGHYHDAPKNPPAGTAAPATATPPAPAKGTGPN